MTSKRDLGPPLAIAGGAVAIAAVIAGFVAVGGPGDARDRRLDEMTIQKISNLISAVECARRLGGATPATQEDVARTLVANRTKVDVSGCSGFLYELDREVPEWKKLEYERISENQIRICAEFVRPSPKQPREIVIIENGFDPSWRHGYPELAEPRPTAGRHCFNIAVPDHSPQLPATPAQ